MQLLFNQCKLLKSDLNDMFVINLHSGGVLNQKSLKGISIAVIENTLEYNDSPKVTKVKVVKSETIESPNIELKSEKAKETKEEEKSFLQKYVTF